MSPAGRVRREPERPLPTATIRPPSRREAIRLVCSTPSCSASTLPPTPRQPARANARGMRSDPTTTDGSWRAQTAGAPGSPRTRSTRPGASGVLRPPAQLGVLGVYLADTGQPDDIRAAQAGGQAEGAQPLAHRRVGLPLEAAEAEGAGSVLRAGGRGGDVGVAGGTRDARGGRQGGGADQRRDGPTGHPQPLA